MFWVLITIIVLILILLCIGLWKCKKGKYKKEPNYRSFLTMGIIWLAVGFFFMNHYGGGWNTLFSLGVIFCIAGLFGLIIEKKTKQKNL